MGTFKLIRVVIDTNVVVSGLLCGGHPGRIVDLWEGKQILPLCSGVMMEEYLRVLAYSKFSLSREEIHFLLDQEILPWFDIIITVSPEKGLSGPILPMTNSSGVPFREGPRL